VRGLLQGLGDMGDCGVDVRPWRSRLPVAVRSRLWDRGVGAIAGDVVHAPSLAFPRARGSLVVVVHDVAWRDAPDAFTRRGAAWHERQLHRAIAAADHFVVPSATTAERLVAAGAVPHRVTVIEEGCDHLPPPDRHAAAAIAGDDYLLTVGTREPRKNLARLFDAYGRARARIPAPPPLVVVGPKGWGSDVAPVEGVTVTGPVDEPTLAGLYAGARAFVYVPRAEGFGLPPVEAMHAGVPVIASAAVPSTTGVALEVDPLDADAIADAIVAVVTDADTRAGLVEAGRVRAAALTWKAAAAAHVALWKSLA
jgi:glycosyltransferase involved in cell wall biosynthesis